MPVEDHTRSSGHMSTGYSIVGRVLIRPVTAARYGPIDGDRGQGDRHRGRHAARVLGRGRPRCVPPARRRRGPRAGPARRADREDLRDGQPGAGPPRRGLASTATCSSSTTGSCPPRSAEAALVQSTRFEPEVFVPPLPGTVVAPGPGRGPRPGPLLRPDGATRCPPGCPATSEPLYLNLDFLDGTKGRPRQHQRRLGRGHQDQLRHLPALQPVPLRRARAPRRSTPRR